MTIASRTLNRYLAREVVLAVSFILLGFLGLFAFFDLLGEFRDLGKGDYNLQRVFAYVLLSLPTHAYELLPVAVLIGTLYVLSHLANNSEFTVMRAAGMSPGQAGSMLLRTALVFAAATFAIGEWVAPAAEEAAQQLRMRALSAAIGQDLRSGLWFKDERAFINVREAREPNRLSGVRIYEFDADYRLQSITSAALGEHLEQGAWRLSSVVQTRFAAEGPRTTRLEQMRWRTAVTPELISVLVVDPERMSAWGLYRYIQHLAANHQKTGRYEIALWKKLFYPIAALVMMALALPFAYMHARSGMVGLKVFLGIMLGIFFHMLNGLFAHVGLLQNWPPFAAAALPGAAFFLAAVLMMWWVERR
ncbi:MAG: LPS export ABC transporter permease LptG [Betaproteobacteria bacterium]|nr:LPS export ABC transporter permease LptG [Betaproteobacteria bacterium]